MVLSGARPKYVLPDYSPEWGIALGVPPQEVERALSDAQEKGQTVGAVLIVSPTYHGICRCGFVLEWVLFKSCLSQSRKVTFSLEGDKRRVNVQLKLHSRCKLIRFPLVGLSHNRRSSLHSIVV